MFVVYAISYGIATPVIGKICTHLGHNSSKPAMSIGAILIVVVYILIGPIEEISKFLGIAHLSPLTYWKILASFFKKKDSYEPISKTQVPFSQNF